MTAELAESAYDAMMYQKTPADLCWFAHQNHYERGLMVMNQAELKPQMKQWRKLFRENKLQIHDYNCKTATYKGKEWHFFVTQPTDLSKCWTDPFAMMLLNEMATGWVYVFDNKQNRDDIVKYVTKVTSKAN